MKQILAIILLLGLMSCVKSYPSLNQIDQYTSDDEKTLYGMLATLQQSLNERDVESWFALYTDDAIITYKKNQPTPKQEVMEDVRSQDLSNWKFQVTDVKVKKSEIQADKATINAILMMKTGNQTRRHPETYYFEKNRGKWLIVKETNP